MSINLFDSWVVRVSIRVVESWMDSMFTEVDWLDFVLILVAMIQLGVVGFDDLVMLDTLGDEERIDMMWF